jgi:hypothetical protein
MKHKISKEYVHFYKFIFFKKWLRILFLLTRAILIIFHNKLQNKSFKKSFMYEKVILRRKDMHDQFKVMLVAPLNAFWLKNIVKILVIMTLLEVKHGAHEK